jgi:hypothetical protein
MNASARRRIESAIPLAVCLALITAQPSNGQPVLTVPQLLAESATLDGQVVTVEGRAAPLRATAYESVRTFQLCGSDGCVLIVLRFAERVAFGSHVTVRGTLLAHQSTVADAATVTVQPSIVPASPPSTPYALPSHAAPGPSAPSSVALLTSTPTLPQTAGPIASSSPSPTRAPSPCPNATVLVQNEAGMRLGSIHWGYNPNMVRNQQYHVTGTISGTPGGTAPPIFATGIAPCAGTLPIADVMELDVKAPDNNFQIQAMMPAKQYIGPASSFTEWDWTVTPQEVGPLSLQFVAFVWVSNNTGGVVRATRVWNEKILVTVTAPSAFEDFWAWIVANLNWLAPTVVAVLALPWLSALFHRKRRKP